MSIMNTYTWYVSTDYCYYCTLSLSVFLFLSLSLSFNFFFAPCSLCFLSFSHLVFSHASLFYLSHLPSAPPHLLSTHTTSSMRMLASSSPGVVFSFTLSSMLSERGMWLPNLSPFTLPTHVCSSLSLSSSLDGLSHVEQIYRNIILKSIPSPPSLVLNRKQSLDASFILVSGALQDTVTILESSSKVLQLHYV